MTNLTDGDTCLMIRTTLTAVKDILAAGAHRLDGAVFRHHHGLGWPVGIDVANCRRACP